MKKYPPTAKELRDWMDQKGLSNKDVAKALRLSDGRVVRFWTAKNNARSIPYPSWYTLRHKFRKRPDGGKGGKKAGKATHAAQRNGRAVPPSEHPRRHQETDA